MAASAAEVAAGGRRAAVSIVPTADDVEEIIEGPAGTLTTLEKAPSTSR